MCYLKYIFKLRSLQVIHSVQRDWQPTAAPSLSCQNLGTNSVSEHQMTPQIIYLLCWGKPQQLLVISGLGNNTLGSAL